MTDQTIEKTDTVQAPADAPAGIKVGGWQALTDAQIAERAKTVAAFRLKITDVVGLIASLKFELVEDTTTTMCVLVTRAGHVEVGLSACIDPAAFDAEIGRTIAFRDALNKLYAKEGYVNRIAFLNREHFNSFAQELKTAGAEPIPAPGAEDDPLFD